MAQIEMKKKVKKEGALKDYQTYEISPRFRIHLVPSPAYDQLSDAKKRLIDAIWEREQKLRKGQLHEGACLSAVEFSDKSLVGQFVPYKYFLAQLCDPSLKPDLQIVPVSVNGLTFASDHVIFARRAAWVAQYPELLELAPSGGIRPPAPGQTQVNLKEQLLEELNDEIGVEKAYVRSIKFFSLIHDLKNDALELCAAIHLKPYVALSSSSEYTQIITVPLSEVPAFVKNHINDCVPLSLELIQSHVSL